MKGEGVEDDKHSTVVLIRGSSLGEGWAGGLTGAGGVNELQLQGVSSGTPAARTDEAV